MSRLKLLSLLALIGGPFILAMNRFEAMQKQQIDREGIQVDAVPLTKSARRGYNLAIEYPVGEGRTERAHVKVSRSLYDKIDKVEHLPIKYLPRFPTNVIVVGEPFDMPEMNIIGIAALLGGAVGTWWFWIRKKTIVPPPLPDPAPPYLSDIPAIDPNVDPAWREARERAYDATLGKCVHVLHEVVPVIPHIDVYVYPPNDERPEFKLITSGMSDRLMHAESNVPPQMLRAELIFYCSEPRDEYEKMLRYFAHFPHDVEDWLGDGHTVPINEFSKAMFGHTRFPTLLFISPIVLAHREMAESISIDGVPLNLLWVVPITAAETELAVGSGTGALLKKFSEHKHPVLFNPERQSYV